MTKKILFIGLPVILIGVTAYAYFFLLKKSYEHFKLIPSSAYIVVTTDLKSMAEKANAKKWDDLYISKKMGESTKPDAENSRFIKDVFSKPLSMGIDPLSDLYFFFQYSDQFQPVYGVAFAVRNSKDLETVLMKIPEKNLPIEKKEVIEKDGYKLFRVSKNAVVAWKDGGGLLAGGIDGEDLDNWVDKVMKQDKSASLADNKYFVEFTEKNQDIGVFINYAGIFNSSVGAMAAASAQNNSYFNSYKTSYATASVLFEKDKISVKNDYYNSDQAAFEKFSFLTDKKVSDGLLRSLTAKQPLAYYGFTFDVNKVFALIDADKGMDKIYSEATKDIGITKTDIKKLLGGEMAATLNDFSYQMVARKHYNWDEKINDMTETMTNDTVLIPEFSLTISINDKAILQKLIDHFQLLKDASGYYSTVAEGYTYYFITDNAGITVTNSKSDAAELTSKKEFQSVIGGKAGEIAKMAPAAFYWNLNLNEYPEIVKTSLKKEMKEENYKLFSDFMNMFTYMDATVTSKTGESNIRMTQSDDNSLWRIIKQTDAVAKSVDERTKAELGDEDEMMKQQQNISDSIASAEAAKAQ